MLYKNKLSHLRKALLSITLVLICDFGKCQQTVSSKSFPITTLINAKWEQTPLHLEIAEYLADENPNLYWDFIKDITDLETPLSSYGKLFKIFKIMLCYCQDSSFRDNFTKLQCCN